MLGINFPRGLMLERAHRIISSRSGSDVLRALITIVLCFQDVTLIGGVTREKKEVCWNGYRIGIHPDYSKEVQIQRQRFRECKGSGGMTGGHDGSQATWLLLLDGEGSVSEWLGALGVGGGCAGPDCLSTTLASLSRLRLSILRRRLLMLRHSNPSSLCKMSNPACWSSRNGWSPWPRVHCRLTSSPPKPCTLSVGSVEAAISSAGVSD
ncbi:hypothetical protein AAFF_G00119080 [Aldrovandia affinis]|uniref:Uncharacterized protein n=1 Tax=Aldrovandia affinis TaxID=143900 RepID=A0AAD7WAH9_9TELE|nr:hypothetical protein AAFF_G00119080 [Aldrovandia affinis]